MDNSALSTQHSALSTQHSALSTQHSALSTDFRGIFGGLARYQWGFNAIVFIFLVGQAGGAWAQAACPGVCIGFTPVTPQAVPLSPEAMGLLALLMAGVGWMVLRKRSSTLMAWVLTAALAGVGMATDFRQALADALYTVVLGGGSNPATVTLPDGYSGLVAVQNSLSTPVTLTSLTVKPGLELVTGSTLQVGSVLAGGSTVAAGLNLAEVDPAPVVPPGSAFAGLGNMTVSDNAGLGPITSISAGGVTDPKGRTMVYSATGLPPLDPPWGTLAIDASTGVILGMYDSIVGDVFTVTVTARATGSAKSASKTFVLSIRNDG